MVRASRCAALAITLVTLGAGCSTATEEQAPDPGIVEGASTLGPSVEGPRSVVVKAAPRWTKPSTVSGWTPRLRRSA
jgi:hypothetical protein